jgi:hypothetical protein
LRLTAHLWTKGEPPPEYIELILCRDVYHCRPNDLDDVPLETVLDHLTCLDVEAEVQNSRAKLR